MYITSTLVIDVPAEDGLSEIDMSKFPLCTTFDEVVLQLPHLEMHDPIPPEGTIHVQPKGDTGFHMGTCLGVSKETRRFQ